MEATVSFGVKFLEMSVANKCERRVNGDIHWRGDVRVVKEGVESFVTDIENARVIAETECLDLVEINPNARPPVMKICDYSKMLYEEKKAAKSAKGNTPSTKEIQLSASISNHDMETKARKVKEFVSDGGKVKVVLSFRGRENSNRDYNSKSMYEFIEMVSQFAVPESLPKEEGNRMIVLLKAKK